jgi:peptide/nickel transport system substrate-binding protein
MTRRIFVLCLLSFALVCGCNRSGKTTETGAANAGPPAQGDWAIVRFESDPDNLNPLITQQGIARYALGGVNNSQIYELLMAYNTKDWDLTEPLLAEAPPTISDDHLTYTFRIRNGVKWHDGQPFTADDVLFTFKAVACPLADTAPLRSYLTELKDIQVDGGTMRFLMSKPNVYNVTNIANVLSIVPKHVFDSEGLLDGFSYKDIIGPKGKTDPRIKKFADQFNAHPANRAPIGTGPYKFEKWESGREIVLARNDNYWGKKPYLDKIVYRIITDYTAALTALKAGDVDVQPRLLPIQYAEQTSGPTFDQQFTKVKYSIPSIGIILWNNDRPFFKDKRVRQALTMLIDRQKIIDSVRLGFGKIGVSPIDPNAKDFNPNIKALPYDPKKAADLLDEAGWKDHDGDGIRDKDGVKFQFEFLGSTGSPVYKQLSPILAEEFRKSGIEMTERVMEFGVMIQSLKDHRFDSSTLNLGHGDLTDADAYQAWHSSGTTGGTNFWNFKNPEADRLLEQARLEFDGEKRKQLYWRWQEIISDEQPVTFLYYFVEPAAYSKRFQNVQWLPLRPGYDLTTWWVPKGLQKYKDATAP